MKSNIIVFKGIKFYNYNFTKLLSKINKGGLLVAPAASALTNISKNKKYQNGSGINYQTKATNDTQN